MPEATIRIPSIYGGISKQAPHLRHPNQVEVADNVKFSVVEGAMKRPGSVYVKTVTELTLGGTYRMHPIVRDGDEKYLIIYGQVSGTATFIITDEAGTVINQVISTEAQTYLNLNTPTPDQLRLATIKDFTFVLNTTVDAKGKASTQYDIDAHHDNYSVMTARTPATNESYHKTNESDALHTKGYWKYDSGEGTYSTIQPRAAGNDDLVTDYTVAGRNPGGFRIMFNHTWISVDDQDYDESEGVGGYLGDAAGGNFADYTWTDGDYVNITGGGGTEDHYPIVSKVSDHQIELGLNDGGSALSGANKSDIDIDGIGVSYNVVWDMAQRQPTDMNEVAAIVQDTMQAAGARNALCTWIWDSATKGHFLFTSPYRGPNGRFSEEDASNTVLIAPDSGYNWTIGTRSFDHSTDAVYTVGTGAALPDDDNSTINDRWSRVAPSDQPSAELDETTMPVQIVRHNAGTETIIKASGPRSYWRLGDASGTAANDETSQSDGTHTDATISAQTSLLTGDADLSCLYVAASSDRTDCGTLGSFGSDSDDNGITLEAWIKTSDTSNAMCVMGILDSSTADVIELMVNTNDGSSYVDGDIYVRIKDGTSGTTADGQAAADVNDNSAHHIMATWNPTDETWEIYVDGVALSVTDITTGSISAMSDFTEDFAIGARGGGTPANYFDGTIDEVAIYAKQLTAKDAERHHKAGSNQYFFDIDQPTWGFRWTGDDDTNPVPSLWLDEHKISDISFHRNRLVLAGDENIVFSRAGEFFDFYIEEDDNLAASDPIDITLSSNAVTLVDFIVPFNRALLVFTKAGQQFELNAPETLTPLTATVTLSTTYDTISVRPQVTNQFVYFAADQQDVGSVYEYFYDDTRITNTAAQITAHTFNLIPTSLKTIQVSTNNNTVVAMPTDEDHFFVYTYFWTDNKKEQSAWAKYQFDSSYIIQDVAIINDDLYMLVDDSTQHIIEKVSLSREVADTSMPYVVHADRQMLITGVQSSSNTTFTLPDSVDDDTIDVVVAGISETTPGLIYDVTTTGGVATLTGTVINGGTSYVGRKYTMDMELSRPYVRDRNGHADFSAKITTKEVRTAHRDSGYYKILTEHTASSDREVTLDKTATATLESVGHLVSYGLGSTEEGQVVSIQSDSPMPVIVVSVEWAVGYDTRDGGR